ncbi:MAG: hypothetical protein PHP44_13790 [Kiritimatiellae bacterium]|nr:hypothetical protein [Kiritimatiellia bacterium]MDD4737163.1 hypothetical protein [Kiritimatiellia bacterium]
MRNTCPGAAESSGVCLLGDLPLRLDLLVGDPRVNPYWHQHVSDADALVILARFLDVLSMDHMKALYRTLPLDTSLPPLAFFLVRDAGEKDFKMSCLECGQKLWVRDYDIGKTGRCPSCQEAFQIPAQSAYLRRQLSLPDNLPVDQVEMGDNPTVQDALQRLVLRIDDRRMNEDEDRVDESAMKRSTIRIQIQDQLQRVLSVHPNAR